jgi:hypothetical protein
MTLPANLFRDQLGPDFEVLEPDAGDYGWIVRHKATGSRVYTGGMLTLEEAAIILRKGYCGPTYFSDTKH